MKFQATMCMLILLVAVFAPTEIEGVHHPREWHKHLGRDETKPGYPEMNQIVKDIVRDVEDYMDDKW